MGKISPVSIKYNIIADIELTSIADKSDVIGAIFGQTEGLLGSNLELRELQKTGKIGRIQVDIKSNKGLSRGTIIVPSSMGKSETAIIAASLETIDRVGPCNAKINIKKIEDVRILKRNFILERAKVLLKDLIETLPDSQEFTNNVTQSVRTHELIEYGEDKLPAGPSLSEEEEIIVVEGRADVLNLLRYGIRNVIGIDGSKSFSTLKKLAQDKPLILFVDGDRGGDLMIRKITTNVTIKEVCKAPDGKEVEELTLKEIQQALRTKLATDSFLEETSKTSEKNKSNGRYKSSQNSDKTYPKKTYPTKTYPKKTYTSNTNTSNTNSLPNVIEKNSKELKSMSDELIGTRGAYLLDETMNILGKIPVKEISETLSSLSGEVFLIIMDGEIPASLLKDLDKHRVKFVISNDKSKNKERKVILNDRLK